MNFRIAGKLKEGDKMENLTIDTFKKYEDYEGMYIVDNYIRTVYNDTVLYANTDIVDVMDYMDDNELWDDYMMYYIDNKGNARYPGF